MNRTKERIENIGNIIEKKLYSDLEIVKLDRNRRVVIESLN